jgi:hypothetical protein
MSAFDNFPSASFDGIFFPWEERTIRGAVREHQHKYPHTAGAALETLGRELYVISFRCNFSDTFKLYPNLYPISLESLRNRFEKEIRADLDVPGLGTITAVCTEWQQTASPKESRSGEKVNLTFLEDIQDAFLINNLIGISTQSLAASQKEWKLNVNKIRADFAAQKALPFFDAITDAVNSVLAIVDTAQAYGNLLEAKILAAAQLIYQADRRVRYLNDPTNAEILQAMLQLWDASRALHEDLLKTGGGLVEFLVSRTMSVIELSKALYNGDGTRAVELMQLNALPDPYMVPPGFRLRYYQELKAA